MTLEVRLSREMRLVDVTMIGVGAMIGAGIFVLTGIAAGVAGPALMLVFVLNGFVALLTAAAYAELGGAIHGAGGGYLWIKRSLPDPSGFLAGWMDWFAHAVACSLYALGFGAYFKEVLVALGLPDLHLPLLSSETWLAVVACGLFTWINYRGASEAGRAGNVVTVGKIAVIGAFILTGLVAMAGRSGWQGSFTPFMTSGWAGVFTAMGLTFIAFEGYEIIAQTSEEVEDPKRNVPRAVFLSILVVVPIYVLVAFVAVGAVTPPEGSSVTRYLGEAKEVALVKAAEQFMTGGALLILFGGLLSTLSALNATIYSSSRVAFAMARDASLPELFARVHERRATPHYSILFSALLIIGMAVALPIEDVAAAASVMFLLLFVGVNVALIRLRRSHPELDRGFKVPFVPLTPILAIACMLFIAAFMFVAYPLAWLAAGGWIALGFAFYSFYSRDRETAFGERVTWMERIERKEYRVLAAISSPRTAVSLMESALAIARSHNGEVVAVSVAEVPHGETLFSGRQQARSELGPLLSEAVSYAEGHGTAVRSVIKIARSVSHGLVQTAREEECNFLVIGRPTAHSFVERLVASIVERVLHDAPCHVAEVYGGIEHAAVKKIVVPVTRGDNSQLAAQLAASMSDWFGAPIRALTVVEHTAAGDDAQRQVDAARETLRSAGCQAALEVLRRKDIENGLIRALRPGELVLIGAPTLGPVMPLVGETIPALIARRGRQPVVVVRHVEELRTRRYERRFFAGR